MAVKGVIKIKDPDFKRALEALAALRRLAVEDLLPEVAWITAVYIQQLEPIEYPPQSNAPMADMWTDRQRRYFFWALKKGKIRVPYRRTQKLGQSIDYEVTFKGKQTATIRGFIPKGSPAERYARYVIGSRSEQSRYFRTRTQWKPLSVMFQQQRENITRAATLALERAIEEASVGIPTH